MLDKLKLLHAYLGGLITEAESGGLVLRTFFDNRDPDALSVDLTFDRTTVAHGCDHDYRRIASGEYECRTCGAVTDEPEGEQWN